MIFITGPSIFLVGDGGIRTRDPLHPMQVRYQAALRPERERNYSRKILVLHLQRHFFHEIGIIFYRPLIN